MQIVSLFMSAYTTTAVSIYFEEGEIYAHQFLSQSAVIGAKNELVETTHAIIPEHTRSKTLWQVHLIKRNNLQDEQQ